jgi:hypothetical protein
MPRPRLLIAAVLLAFLLPARAQTLPGPEFDRAWGENIRQQVLARVGAVRSTPFVATGEDVFRHLLETAPVRGSGLPFDWRVTVLSTSGLNAFSTAGGQVYVYGDLAQHLGQNPALWAAVLGHEVAHTALRHQVKAFIRAWLRRQRLRAAMAAADARRAAGDASGALGIELGATLGVIAARTLDLHFSREEEHEADEMGMLMMAEAGYHPAYVFVLHHLMRTLVGDQSHLRAFFSTHPRWDTRDRRDEAIYWEAVSVFNRRWPDSSRSPGGTPPPLVFLGTPRVETLKAQHQVEVTVPVTVADGHDETLQAALLFAAPAASTPAAPAASALRAELRAPAPPTVLRPRCSRNVQTLPLASTPAGQPAALVPCSALLQPVAVEGDWVRVRAGTTEGYLLTSQLEIVPPPPTETQLAFRLPAADKNAAETTAQVCVTTPAGLLLDCTRSFHLKAALP